jgi:transcriptional regulator with XRE-family HTH domain
MCCQPTLLQIRQTKGLALEAIAALAGMTVEDVYYLEAGIAYPQAVIDNVLSAVSRLSGEHYTRETVGGLHVKEQS